MSGADIKPVVVEMAQACTFPDCDCDSPYRAAGACVKPAQAAERAVQLPPLPAGLLDVPGPIWPFITRWLNARPGVEAGDAAKRIEDAITQAMQDYARAAVAALPAAPAEPIARAMMDAGELPAAPAPAARVDAPEAVPWPAVTRYSGGAFLNGVSARVWVQFSDDAEEIEYVPATAPAAPSDKCLTDFEVSQMMHAAGMQGGTDDGAPWWLVFARAVERRTAARVRAALATAPAAAAVPVRLTSQQLDAAVNGYGPQTDDEEAGFRDGIRAAERIHGITQQPGGER